MKKDLLRIFSSMKKDLSGSSSLTYVRGTPQDLLWSMIALSLFVYISICFVIFIYAWWRRWSSQAISLAINWLYLANPTAVYVTCVYPYWTILCGRMLLCIVILKIIEFNNNYPPSKPKICIAIRVGNTFTVDTIIT